MTIQRVAPLPAPGPRLKELPMWPHNVERIKGGAKSTTFRAHALKDGWYRLKGTNLLVYLRQSPPNPINWNELAEVVRQVHAESEGYKTVAEFINDNKRVRGFRDFINGKPYYRHVIEDVRHI